jgi:serine/threonine-protein kinase
LLDRVGKLPNDMSIRITRQICRALMAAHAKGIVHRDMKPENVFLVGDLTSPRVKIIDFGISKQDDCNAKLTRTGMVMGTPAYMAPEQARGEHVDNRADVYGVGGILYRCVTGHKPYEGEDGAMVLTQVLTEEPKRPRAVEPMVPGELEVVIERAMARDTADRLPSMADFEAELAALDSSPVAVDGALPSMLPPAPLNWPDAVQVDKTSNRTQHAMRTKREARGARPILVLTTAVGYLWCAALLVSGIADAIRFSKSTLVRFAGMPTDAPALALGGKLTANESVLVALGVLAATITPLLIWVRHLARKVWRNTASSVAFAARAKASLSAGISTYGLSMLALAITESVVLRQSPGTLQTVWGVPIVVASFAMLLITWWMLARRRM